MKTLQFLQSSFWAVAREANTLQVLPGRARPTSFPFISADTFRSIGDIVVNNEDIFTRFLDFRDTANTIYMEMDGLKDGEMRFRAVKLIERCQQVNQKPTRVILHNSDTLPPEDFFEKLQQIDAQVFSVNVLDGFFGVIPIPLGIENLTRRRGGTLEDFLLFRESRGASENKFLERSKLVFANFRTRTNRHAREGLAVKISRSRHGFSEGGMSVREYRKQLLTSMFVVSPAGNGIDCFRTWESIYLGAVPVVLKSQLAESLTEHLPIWAVNDWEEMLDQSDEELREIFLEISSKSTDKALFPYWHNKILSD